MTQHQIRNSQRIHTSSMTTSQRFPFARACISSNCDSAVASIFAGIAPPVSCLCKLAWSSTMFGCCPAETLGERANNAQRDGKTADIVHTTIQCARMIVLSLDHGRSLRPAEKTIGNEMQNDSSILYQSPKLLARRLHVYIELLSGSREYRDL